MEQPTKRVNFHDYFRLLKRKFRSSEYLVLASFLAADLADRNLTEETAARGKEIFRLMNRQHRILTNKTDSVSAVLMAFSGKTDNELIDDMEACYKVLKTRFSGSAAQPASQAGQRPPATHAAGLPYLSAIVLSRKHFLPCTARSA